jgi:TonB family protein
MTFFQMFQWGLSFAAIFLSSFTNPLAQIVASAQINGVVLTKLVQPVYPPLARSMRITGDVDLMLSVRQDGVVESAAVVSGHPLLKQAALLSVEQSRFECRKCTEPATAYRLVYTFQIEGECDCEPLGNKAENIKIEQSFPVVSDAEHRVTVVALVQCTCDPAPTRKIRSLKCLYLWKCTTKS